jgi:chorismate mutase
MIEDLNQLRESIDVLDNEILKALAQRMKLSDRVIAAKNGVAAFRPGREAALVRELAATAKADGLNIAPEVILCVWRQIMAASLGRQNGDQACGVHHKAMPAAAWHMGSALSAFVSDDIAWLIETLAAGRCRYVLVPAHDDNNRDLLACLDQHHHLKIIARTPLYSIRSVQPAFIIADYLPDSSGDDISLYAVRTAHGFDLVCVAGHHELVTPSSVPDGARLIGAFAR